MANGGRRTWDWLGPILLAALMAAAGAAVNRSYQNHENEHRVRSLEEWRIARDAEWAGDHGLSQQITDLREEIKDLRAELHERCPEARRVAAPNVLGPHDQKAP